MVFESVGVTIAMYALIQFFYQIKDDIRQHKPLLKITAIKLVIFLSFWQTTLISFLTSSGTVKATSKIQTPDIKVGIPALLLCIEMAIFSVFHIWSFSWKPYTLGSREYLAEAVPGEESRPIKFQGGFLGIKAIYDAFNAWDMLKATGRGARWLFKGRKTRHDDPSYDMTRKNTQDSDFGPGGQKLSSLAAPTAYTGVAPPPRYAGEERDNLLAHSQGMAVSQDPASGVQTHGSESPDNHSDIGLAASSYEDKYLEQYDRPPPSTTYPPYPVDEDRQGGAGAAAMPYMPPVRVQQQPYEQFDNRQASRPHIQPPSGDPRWGNRNQDNNFL